MKNNFNLKSSFITLTVFLASFQFQYSSFQLVTSFGIPKDIFILAGQSNMAGRGGVFNERWDHYVPEECTPDVRILRLNINLTWEEAHEPLHSDIDALKRCGVGPGMAFANTLLKKDPLVGVIGLVPCAVGGTNILEWKRGKFLYNQLVKRANAALQEGGRIRAMLWYQGESDSDDQTRAQMYGSRLKEFFSDVRLDLASPLLPIVEVALASTAGRYVDIVRKAQLEIDLPNVICIDAKGLEVKKNDELHLATSAQVQLGKMFADAVLSCLNLATDHEGLCLK